MRAGQMAAVGEAEGGKDRSVHAQVPGGAGAWPTIPALGAMLGTFACICVTWVFFRAATLGDAVGILKAVATMQGGAAGWAAEDIDTVVCTHLHFDHVGGNLAGGVADGPQRLLSNLPTPCSLQALRLFVKWVGPESNQQPPKGPVLQTGATSRCRLPPVAS